jgi:hypothetical protein
MDFVFTKDDLSKNLKEVKDLTEEFGIEYPAAIGSLLWILHTYPRLRFAVCKLAKCMSRPGKRHFKALMHLLHHVRCHHSTGITFYSRPSRSPLGRILDEVGIDTNTELVAATDSSWQDCPDTGRSTGGYYVLFCGGIVDSSSNVPGPVAMSSAEGEFMQACAGAISVAHIKMLVLELDNKDPDETLTVPIMVDNQSTIASSLRDTKRTRHIARRFHYVRWATDEGHIKLVWTPSHLMLADVLSKNLPATASTFMLFRAICETEVKL